MYLCPRTRLSTDYNVIYIDMEELITAKEQIVKARKNLISSIYQFVAKETNFGDKMISLQRTYYTEVGKHSGACTLFPEDFTRLAILDTTILCAFDEAGRTYLIDANEDRQYMSSYVSMDTLVKLSDALLKGEYWIVDWWDEDSKEMHPEFSNVLNHC